MVRRVNPKTPYAMVVRFKPLRGSTEDTVWGYRKDLTRALAECLRETRAWLQLIGGQYPGLFWLVIDTRSGAEHHPSFSTRGGARHGEQDTSTGTLY